MASERKVRMEVDLRQQLLSRGQDADRKRRGPDEETVRKIRRLEDTIAELQKNLAAQKQVSTVMQVTYRGCSVNCLHFLRIHRDSYNDAELE